MKFFKVIVALILISSASNAQEVFDLAYNAAGMAEIEKLFKENVKPGGEMVFTHVPRGLIISIDENVFFKPGHEKIRCGGLEVLNEIAGVLHQSDKSCVIEGHTESANPEISSYKNNWELSLARANNITMYLMRCSKVSPERLFPIGYGDFVPFMDRDKKEMDNRIDFVIIDYETSR